MHKCTHKSMFCFLDTWNSDLTTKIYHQNTLFGTISM